MSASSALPGAWISLLQYANKNGVSLSTLRRYIKAGKIKHKSEEGRYLVWDDDADHNLESELKRAREEIAELKMLVALYEQQQKDL